MLEWTYVCLCERERGSDGVKGSKTLFYDVTFSVAESLFIKYEAFLLISPFIPVIHQKIHFYHEELN